MLRLQAWATCHSIWPAGIATAENLELLRNLSSELDYRFALVPFSRCPHCPTRGHQHLHAPGEACHWRNQPRCADFYCTRIGKESMIKMTVLSARHWMSTVTKWFGKIHSSQCFQSHISKNGYGAVTWRENDPVNHPGTAWSVQQCLGVHLSPRDRAAQRHSPHGRWPERGWPSVQTPEPDTACVLWKCRRKASELLREAQLEYWFKRLQKQSRYSNTQHWTWTAADF